MIQSHIWITCTSVNEYTLSTAIAAEFFKPESFNFSLFFGQKKPNTPDDTHIQNIQQNQKLESLFQTYLNHGQILQPQLNNKKDFKNYSLELYQNFTKPTLLFLGNLSDYSHTVQEGMLKLLEEPPHNLTIVMFIRSRAEILPTIVSRSAIHTLPDFVLRECVSSTLVEKTAAIFPSPQATVQLMLQGKTNLDEILKNIAKAERNEIDFWLWQLEYVCIHLLQSSPHSSIVAIISTLQHTRKLNDANVQKKLALFNLNSL